MNGSTHRKMRYATRLNAFRSAVSGSGRVVLNDLVAAAAKVGHIDAADLNYPDHFDTGDPRQALAILESYGISLNGLAMRYGGWPEFALGAFTNPSAKVRRKALDATRRALDALAAMDGNLMTLWMGQDGFDYSFQADYSRLWDRTVEALEAVADHNPNLDIAIEYKPNEPRAHALLPDLSTTLLAIREVNRSNLGVTLDFAHLLYADETPACSAMLVDRYSRLMGVHLNDGYGKRDDGLMVGAVHPLQTIELFVALADMNYGGVIYFDTFPDQSGLDPGSECRTNILNTERLLAAAERLRDNSQLKDAIARQDATESHLIVSRELFSPG